MAFALPRRALLATAAGTLAAGAVRAQDGAPIRIGMTVSSTGTFALAAQSGLRGAEIWVDDVNGDGKLDIVVGDSVTLIAPAKGVSAEEFKKKFAAWQDAIAKASNVLSSEKADQATRNKANEEFNKLYQQRSEFMNEDRTGFVWLYLQK